MLAMATTQSMASVNFNISTSGIRDLVSSLRTHPRALKSEQKRGGYRVFPSRLRSGTMVPDVSDVMASALGSEAPITPPGGRRWRVAWTARQGVDFFWKERRPQAGGAQSLNEVGALTFALTSDRVDGMKANRLPTSLAVAALASVFTTACSDDSSGEDPIQDAVDAGFNDGGVVGGDGFDPDTVVQALASASCAFERRCRPAFAAFGIDPSTCESDFVLSNRDTFVQHEAAIAAGRISFSQVEFDACTAEFRNADCDLGVTVGGACARYFTGVQPLNGGCRLAAECGDGLTCVPVSNDSECGACQQRQGVGGDCSITGCAVGLACFQLNDGRNLCLAANDVGAPCGDIQSGLCAGELWCDNVTNPTQSVCNRLPSEGQTCDPQFTTAGDCNILANLTCVNGTCAQINWNPAGSVCDNGTNSCRIDTVCEADMPGATTGVCTALPTTGAMCQTELGCAGDDFCDPANVTCTAPTPAGGMCGELVNGAPTQTSICALGSLCSPTTLNCETTVPWSQCN